MNVLVVYAHPEPTSLNGSLKDFSVQRLRSAGHDVRVSDLYAMQWKAVLDRSDFPALSASEPLHIGEASARAYADGTQTDDVRSQQEALLWADAVLFYFPLWWFSLTAILKGWFERVYAYGFGYGVGEHSESHWGDRYGEGVLAGKRAMLVVTMGGWEPHYSDRGVNGPIADLLFPIQHGTLFYPGFEVMEPYLLYKVHGMDERQFDEHRERLGERLDRLWVDEPIAFRKQNAGDYDIPALTLKPNLGSQTRSGGFHLHTSSDRTQNDT